MERPLEDALLGTLLHRQSQVHDEDVVRDVAHDGEVVRDEEIRDAELRCKSAIRFSTCACTETSSADTGSSATTNAGSSMSARAIAMRWRCPPENMWG
jgi:hypothetical protein